MDRTAAYRDQALVFLLAYSGARSAELVAVSDDQDRNGLRWGHVDLDAGTMQVFGKNRTRESAPILDDGLDPLRRWKQLRDPDDDEAVFPRLDNAAKALDPTPSITTQTARDILAKLCEWSDYEFEEPLKPHGARRRCDDHRWDRSTRSISYRMLIRRLRCTGSMALIIQYCCGEYTKVETMGLRINYCAVA